MRRTWELLVLGWLAATLLCAGSGCERENPAARSAAAGTQDQVEPLTPKPEYSFAPGLEDAHPRVVAFLRRFMETSLVGDYAGYRRLVSRQADPESRARFETILNSLRTLRIESIEEVELEQVPQPAYRVISEVEFLPNRKVALRRGDNSRVAILVFEEEGELRMAPAPSEQQPLTEEAGPAAEPATSAPSYPWDADGDY